MRLVALALPVFGQRNAAPPEPLPGSTSNTNTL